MLKKMIKGAAGMLGLEIHRKDALSSENALKNALSKYGINLAIDVGANEGQFVNYLREAGYKGKVISYEPLSDAYEKLIRLHSADSAFEARKKAIGDSDGTISINVSKNSVSSSILPILKEHVTAAPESSYSGTETVPIAKLDSEFPKSSTAGSNIFLKIDVQGYESKVLDGAGAFLKEVKVLETEMSFVPLYDGQILFEELYHRLCAAGFECIDLSPVFRSQDSRLLQVDGLFVRK